MIGEREEYKKYLNDEAYSEYLELFANSNELENVECKIRGFGFEKLKIVMDKS